MGCAAMPTTWRSRCSQARFTIPMRRPQGSSKVANALSRRVLAIETASTSRVTWPAPPRLRREVCHAVSYGIAVYIYWSDHPPPHFHADYAEHGALIDIEEGVLIAGVLPRRAALVEEWRALHEEELKRAWERAERHEDPGTIEPLP